MLKIVSATMQNAELRSEAGAAFTEIIARDTQTFLWLQRYDESLWPEPKSYPGGLLPIWTEALPRITRPKTDFAAKGRASVFFGNEREEGRPPILRHIDQSGRRFV
ncbi:hypothetical protein C4901_02060 [Acidiferrobacter sp. SPIII_3]|nr:hypothetical protein C4901_02060 [Acidiferrobacter sp. SPIII_3]